MNGWAVALALILALHGAPVMAHCCAGDPDVLWSWDGDDGAPLAADFGLIIDAELGSGTGINSTNALRSVSYTSSNGLYAEATHVLPNTYDVDGLMIHGDECGNPRRNFAIGGHFNGKNLNSATEDGFFLMQIGDTGDDDPVTENSLSTAATALVGVKRYGRHLKIETNPDNIGGVWAIQITNVFDEVTFPFRFIELIGSISSYDSSMAEFGLSTRTTDAWVELRIDGVPMVTGDDFEIAKANYLAGIERPCVHPRVGDLTTLNSKRGWNIVNYGPQGDADCLYIKEKANYCNHRELKPEAGSQTVPDCAAPGPGGSSFDGQAQGPRVMHPGGYPVKTYVAPTGGGVSATASNPTEPQSLTGITTPLFSVDVTLTNGTVRRASQVGPLLGSSLAPVTWLIQRISPIEYARSDRFGHTKAQTWEIDLADPDGLVRADLDAVATRTYKRWQAQVFAESDTAHNAGTARLSGARGRCISASTSQPQVVTLTFSDELSYPSSPVSLDRKLPIYAIGDLFRAGATATGVTFTMDAPGKSLDKALPIIFGEASDEWRLLSGDPLDAPVGIVKAIDIGDVLLGGGAWRGFAICQYACKGIAYEISEDGSESPAVFGSNLNPECSSSVRLDPDVLENQILLPNVGAWSSYFATPYIDVTHNGITVRTTMMFARGPIAEQHVNGQVPISLNLWGKEVTGDGSGTLITDGAQIVQALFHWPIFQRAKLGTESLPTFSDGVAKFRTSSAVTCTTTHHTRLASGYVGAVILDDFKAASDWLAQLLVSYDLREHTNHFGQVVLTTLDDTVSISGLTTYTAQLHVRGDSFKTTSERSAELENLRRYDFGPEPATGRLTGQPEPVKVQTSIDAWDAASEPYPGDDMHLVGVYDATVALDVVGRAVNLTKDGITRGEFASDLDLFAKRPGDLVRLTDFRGLGSAGWTGRVLMVDAIVLNANVSNPPQEDDLGVTIRWEDMHVSLVAPSGMVGGGVTADGSTTSRVGFNVLGSSAGGTGWVLGSSAANTGWRLG